MSPDDLIAHFYPNDNPTRRACRLYCLECIAHRLRRFGFEPFINCYDAPELVMLGLMLGGHQRDVLFVEAAEKDPQIETWLRRHYYGEAVNA